MGMTSVNGNGIVRGLSIRNYRIVFPLKSNQFIELRGCFNNLIECGVDCRETYNHSLFVVFEELSFNFFSSGKGILYFRRENFSVEEADSILATFFGAFLLPFVFEVVDDES